MSDAVLRTANAIVPERRDPSPDVLIAITGLEANDNCRPALRQQPETRMFELPAFLWVMTAACYAVFLLALLGATGGARAAFAIAISALFVTMFFGTATVMLEQAGSQPQSPLSGPGKALQTANGPLSRSEVCGQVLVVPVAVATFGIVISIISAIVM